MTTLVVEPITDLNWGEFGRCLEIGPEIFFCERTAAGNADISLIRAAKKVCQGCEVMEFCRANALLLERGCTASELSGVVGGLTAKERGAITGKFCRECKERPRREGTGQYLCDECIGV